MTPSHSSRPFRNCLTINNNKYKDGGFKLWKTKGIQTIKDLYMDGILLTFQELCDKHQIPSKHFFFNIHSLKVLCLPGLQILCTFPNCH